jgi:Methylase-associated X1
MRTSDDTSPARLSQTEMHQRFIHALGGKVQSTSDLSRKPLELDLMPPLPHRVRLYVYNATRPPGGRPLGEHKVQLMVPGQARGERGYLDHSDGRIVLLCGYARDEDVFIFWDGGLYTDFAWSRNVQVKSATLAEACAMKIATQERRLRTKSGNAREIVVAAPYALLVDAIIARVERTRARMLED